MLAPFNGLFIESFVMLVFGIHAGKLTLAKETLGRLKGVSYEHPQHCYCKVIVQD